jgi:hypothetical protein
MCTYERARYQRSPALCSNTRHHRRRRRARHLAHITATQCFKNNVKNGMVCQMQIQMITEKWARQRRQPAERPASSIYQNLTSFPSLHTTLKNWST